MQKDDLVYVRHIRDSISKLESFVAGLSREEFMDDRNAVVQSGVVRELEVIGEAASKLSADYRKAHPDLPWREMIDTRNKMIHDYLSVDYALVWEILVKDLPELRLKIKALLPD